MELWRSGGMWLVELTISLYTTFLGQLSVGEEFLCEWWSNPISSWVRFEIILSWVPYTFQGWMLINSLKLEGPNCAQYVSFQTWLPLRQTGWLSPSTLRGPGGKSILGFPSKVSNRLRPQVVMAVRDPLPGLQSNKATYLGKTVRLWPENLDFYYLLPGRHLMIQTFVGFVRPNVEECAAERHNNCSCIEDRGMDV